MSCSAVYLFTSSVALIVSAGNRPIAPFYNKMPAARALLTDNRDYWGHKDDGNTEEKLNTSQCSG